MRIVKPTDPPSMAIVVDTILYGDVTLPVAQKSHPALGRVDLVTVRDGVVSIHYGTPSQVPAAPALAVGMRALAQLYIPPNARLLATGNIVELEPGQDPYRLRADAA